MTPPLYPRMHLLPDGNVFYSGPGTSSALFNPSNTSWTLNVAHTNYGGTRTYGTSVLLPLTPANNYDPIVTIMGGNSPATNTTELIDMGAESPKWVYGLDMSEARIEMNAVILADGRILAVGGSVNDEDTDSLSLKADLFDLRKVNLNTNPPNLGTAPLPCRMRPKDCITRWRCCCQTRRCGSREAIRSGARTTTR